MSRARAIDSVPRWLSLVENPAKSVALVHPFKKAKATGSNPVRGSTQHPLGRASALASSGRHGPATQAAQPFDLERSSQLAHDSSTAYPSPYSPSPQTFSQTAKASRSYPYNGCSTGYSGSEPRAARSFPSASRSSHNAKRETYFRHERETKQELIT